MFAQSPKTRLLGGRTLDGTKSAKASVGEFLVLFAVKKYIEPRGRKSRLVADQKAAKNASRRTANTPECAAPLENRFSGG